MKKEIMSFIKKLPFVSSKGEEEMTERMSAPQVIEDYLTDRSKQMIRVFQYHHEKGCDNGRQYDYKIGNASGIGISVSVVCQKCNEEENVTDYENW